MQVLERKWKKELNRIRNNIPKNGTNMIEVEVYKITL
jgi:hypothetical protein